MKHKNCKGSYTEMFRQDLYRAYKETLEEHLTNGVAVFNKVVADAINKPSKRFYASEEQVYKVIRHISDNTTSNKILPTKKEMYYEIYSRVIAMQRNRPELPLKDVVCMVCNQPAPRFYITPKSARTILFNILKCKREKKTS